MRRCIDTVIEDQATGPKPAEHETPAPPEAEIATETAETDTSPRRRRIAKPQE